MINESVNRASGPRRGLVYAAAQPRGQQLSHHYASHLLRSLGVASGETWPQTYPQGQFCRNAARDWAESGLMWLSGVPTSPPMRAAHALPSCARGAIFALQALHDRPLTASLDGARLLAERSSELGYTRGGRVSANGSCHLLTVADGIIALNLARPEDWSLLPAWLETDARVSDWNGLACALSQRTVTALVSRGRLLGLPVSGTVNGADNTAAVPPWFRVCGATHVRTGSRGARRPLVIDLSALWAGPLCSHLLLAAGARVIKVESIQRPDATRMGAPAFFDVLHAGKESVLVDFESASGRDHLQQLLAAADIVIESSRPRALQQLGIDAPALVAHTPGKVWLSLTGYGRALPQANWVAFGDDAGVAAGLCVDASGALGGPYFCGDALCDPLAGLHAAVAAMAFWHRGEGALLDINLCDVAAHSRAFFSCRSPGQVRYDLSDKLWYLEVGGERMHVQQPLTRQRGASAVVPGRDTARVLGECGLAC